MPTPAIIESVKKVHDELGEAQPASADVDTIKQQLATVMVEPTHEPHYANLGARLRSAFAGFQTDHPQLAASMETLANELSKVGL